MLGGSAAANLWLVMQAPLQSAKHAKDAEAIQDDFAKAAPSGLTTLSVVEPPRSDLDGEGGVVQLVC